MHLIDFEYGGMNYRGFDIANHFNEMAGGTDNGTPDYSLFPSREHMRMFCTAYLEKYGGKTTVDQLLEEVDIFVLLDHWYWGIWAINMASSSVQISPLDHAHSACNHQSNRVAELIDVSC